MIEIIATIGLFAHLTSQQVPKTAVIISFSTISFASLYGVLKQTRFLHPEERLKDHIESEWRSRIIGTLHAIILIIGSIMCFLEWPHYVSPSHAWHVENRQPENEYYPVLFASIFAGYLQYDFLWLLLHRKKNYDLGSMIHHSLYIAITHYVLHGYFFARPFAWLAFCEISTPCLHLRWFYAVTNKKENPWYRFWSMLFAATFLFSRVLCYGWGIVDIWRAKDILITKPYGLYAVIVGIHLGYVLNLFWAQKVFSALKKSISVKKSAEKKKV